MPPPSSKTALIEAALEIIEQQGLPALTYESLSARTGKSRSGLLYHFPSKEAMVAAARDYTVDQWHDAALKHLSGSFDEATAAERAYAYLLATVEEQAAAESSHYQDAVHSEFSEEVWRTVRGRWIDFTEGVLTPSQHMAVLAADGLWLDHGSHRMLPNTTREHVIRELLKLTKPEGVA